MANFFSSLGLPSFKEVGAQNHGTEFYGTEMHFKWLKLGTVCAVLKWLSVFTSHCSSEGRGLRGEAETASATGAGNGKPGILRGNSVETGDRRGGQSATRQTAFLFKHKERCKWLRRRPLRQGHRKGVSHWLRALIIHRAAVS